MIGWGLFCLLAAPAAYGHHGEASSESGPGPYQDVDLLAVSAAQGFSPDPAASAAQITSVPSFFGTVAPATGSDFDIALNPTGFLAGADPTAVAARAAFERAASRWESFINDDITVNLDVSLDVIFDDPVTMMTPSTSIIGGATPNVIGVLPGAALTALGDDAESDDGVAQSLGSLAGPSFLLPTAPFTVDVVQGSGETDTVEVTPDFTLPAFSFTRANAKAVGLLGADDAAPDASIVFNSNFAFDFDNSDGVGADRFRVRRPARNRPRVGLYFRG